MIFRPRSITAVSEIPENKHNNTIMREREWESWEGGRGRERGREERRVGERDMQRNGERKGGGGGGG